MPIEKFNIPNFELCRCIGRGSYGDVWLAKSISGTWCAIKVVWRKNFPDSDSFEQEFSGILYYEPISRSHDGLMKILYVGRDPENQFYYYVNELADDSHRVDQSIIPESYYPSSLAQTIRQNPEGMKIKDLLLISKELFSALSYLHHKGLIHRDIKPSNIIFINGKAKLADIGSVSLIGQKSLVGTQGYMPPEGPITKQSDLYSAGKVIYEAFTGLDRLEFPKLPQHKQLIVGSRRLNKLICKLASPQIKDRYSSAEEAQSDIEKIIQGKDLKKTWHGVQVALLMLAFLLSVSLLAISWGYFTIQDQKEEILKIKATQGWFKVSSQPQGAQVSVINEKQILGITPLNQLFPFPENKEIEFKFSLEGYEDFIIKLIPKAQELVVLNPILIKKIETKPVNKANLFHDLAITPIDFVDNEKWENTLGISLVKFENIYVSQMEITNHNYNQYILSIGNAQQKALKRDNYPVVNITREQAKSFCQWLTYKEQQLGLLAQNEYYRLPSDQEWSALLGYQEREELNPFEREKEAFLKNKKLFSSNQNYNLKSYTANLAGKSYSLNNDNSPFIEGYEDGWAQQSLVGSYEMDKNGLYDMIGNVWEWIDDDYTPLESYPFCRGGSWKTYDSLKLNYAYRNVTEKSFKSPEIGFRIVLAQESLPVQ